MVDQVVAGQGVDEVVVARQAGPGDRHHLSIPAVVATGQRPIEPPRRRFEQRRHGDDDRGVASSSARSTIHAIASASPPIARRIIAVSGVSSVMVASVHGDR